VTGPGKYGRRGDYPFELRVDTVLVVRGEEREIRRAREGAREKARAFSRALSAVY
jgi:hypothetical protein